MYGFEPWFEPCFLEWANHILDWAKDYFNTFHGQILIQMSYLCLKFHKCQIPVPDKWIVLPIGADAHVPSQLVRFLFLINFKPRIQKNTILSLKQLFYIKKFIKQTNIHPISIKFDTSFLCRQTQPSTDGRHFTSWGGKKRRSRRTQARQWRRDDDDNNDDSNSVNNGWSFNIDPGSVRFRRPTK